MDQADMQSPTVDSAAERLMDSGLIDQIASEEPVEASEDVEDQGIEAETEVDAEVEVEAQAETEEEVETDEEEDTSEITTFGELANALEADEEGLMEGIKVQATIDGVTEEVTLKEAVAGYQRSADYQRKTQQLAQERRELAETAKQQRDSAEYQHQVAANVLATIENGMVGDLERINALRQTDPQQWAQEYAAFNERKDWLAGLKTQAAQAYMMQTQQAQQETEAQMKERLRTETEMLQTAIPNFEQEKPQLVKYLSEKVGFTEQELSSVADHRLLVMAHKAMKFDTQTPKAELAKKKVKDAPKLQKPAAKQQVNVKRSNLQKAKGKLKKSGHVKDAAAAIENLL